MKIRRIVAAGVMVGGALALAAGPAAAHVTVDPAEAPAGGYGTFNFKIGHGCDGSPTTSVKIALPSGSTSVHAQAKPGWTATFEEGPLPEPIESEGETITTGVTAVTWTGGPLPDNEYDTFGISMKVPEGSEGTVLEFPTVQTCESGSINWVEPTVEGEPEPESPAPLIVLASAEADEHGGGADDAMDDAADVTSTETASSDDSDSSSNTLAIVALVVGGLGLVAGGTALLRKPKATT